MHRTTVKPTIVVFINVVPASFILIATPLTYYQCKPLKTKYKYWQNKLFLQIHYFISGRSVQQQSFFKNNCV
jgi:hypothetical protein